MNIQHEAAGSAQSTDPFSPVQLRILKIAVVVMGVILVLGFLAVLGRIAYLVTRTAKPAAHTIAKDLRLPLPEGATVRSLALSGDRLAVHFDAHAGAGVAILDLLTGEPVTHVQFVPRGPGR